MRIKIKIIIGFITILFVTCSCNIRKGKAEKQMNYIPYYLEVYKADSLQLIGKNKEAFEKLDSLFKEYKPLNQIYIYEMASYVRLAELEKRKENIKPVLESLIKDWGLNKERIEKDSLISLAVQGNKIGDEEIKNWEAIFQSKLNKEYQAKIEEIRAKDQGVRKSYKNKDTVTFVDSKNYVEFISLLAQYGYPTYQKIGMPLNLFLNPFYIHIAQLQDFEKKEALIMKYVKSGEASPMNIYSLIDGKYVHQYQTYYFGDDGTWSGFNAEQSAPKDTINKRRRERGLPSLEYAVWKNNK